LAPDAQRALARLGIGLPRHLLADPQLFAVEALDLATGRRRRYPRHYMNVDRLQFDRWLWTLLPDRVFAFDLCLATGVRQGQRGFIVSYRRAGKEYSIEARCVIGTYGTARPVPGLPGVELNRVRRYLALQEWFAIPDGAPYYQAIFDPLITDYYAWTIPKNGELILGAALAPDKDPLARFALLKRKMTELGLDLSTPLRRRASFLLRPLFTASRPSRKSYSSRLVLAGEAAGFISPSSGEGLSYAFESASLLATAIRTNGPECERAYRNATTGLRRKIAMKCLKNPFLYNKGLRSFIMACGWGDIGRRSQTTRLEPAKEIKTTA
jgi:flavin-dependent dehydrogenase